MSRYTSIWSGFWDNEKLMSITSDRTKLFYIFLLSNHSSNLIGYYKLPTMYAALTFKTDESEIEGYLEMLQEAKLIKYNPKKKLVLIVDYMRYTTVNGPTQFQGLGRELKLIDRNYLDNDFVHEIIKNIKDPEVVLANHLPINMAEMLHNKDVSNTS